MIPPLKIVLATRNADKIREIEAIFASVDVSLHRVDEFADVPDVVEDGDTLEANALKKARAVRDATGLCALADDTGLEVDALDGAPGAYSARYAGGGPGISSPARGRRPSYDENCAQLLRDMEHVTDTRRTARFRTVMALSLVDDVAEVVSARLREDDPDALSARLREDDPDTLSAHHPENDPRAAIDGEWPDVLLAEGMVEGRITRERRGAGGFGYDPIFEVYPSGETMAELSLEEKNRISHRYRALVEMRALLRRYGLAGAS